MTWLWLPFAGGTEPSSEVYSAPRASSSLFPAWSGAPPSLEHYTVLLAGLMRVRRHGSLVSGQMLERLLKDAPDHG